MVCVMEIMDASNFLSEQKCNGGLTLAELPVEELSLGTQKIAKEWRLPFSSSSNGFEHETSYMDVDRNQEEQSEDPLFEVLSPSPPSPAASFPVSGWGSSDFCSSQQQQFQSGGTVPTIGAGLLNLGNTCFLNAVLQCLTYTSPFVHSLRNFDHKTPCAAQGFCALCALRAHVDLTLSSSGKIIEPSALVNNLSNISSSFRKWQQEDAHEYLHCLLEVLHNCTLGPQPSNLCLFFEGDSFVKKIFGGRLRSQIKCNNCSHCSDTLEPMIDLSLEINEVDSLISALKSFTQVETIDSDVKYVCENCKQGVSVMKQLTIDQAPDVLMIQLKRFTNNGFLGEKISKEIAYPQTLDLEPFVSNTLLNQGVLKYELYAVLVHVGLSSNSGHYYCLVHSSPEAWYELDDLQVTRISEKFALKQQAYILFYYRQGSPWFSSVLEPHLKNSLRVTMGSPKSVLEEMVTSDDSNSSRENSSGIKSEMDIIDISKDDGYRDDSLNFRTPESQVSGKKRFSVGDDSLNRRLKQKHVVKERGKRTSCKRLPPNSVKKSHNLDSCDPYSFDFESEQIPKAIFGKPLNAKEMMITNWSAINFDSESASFRQRPNSSQEEINGLYLQMKHTFYNFHCSALSII